MRKPEFKHTTACLLKQTPNLHTIQLYFFITALYLCTLT